MTTLNPHFADRPPTRYLTEVDPTHDDAAVPHYLAARYPHYAVIGGLQGVAGELPTGVTAGAPGAFTPTGAMLPYDLAALNGLGALGETAAWTTGQNVVLGDTHTAHWDGSAWVANAAP